MCKLFERKFRIFLTGSAVALICNSVDWTVYQRMTPKFYQNFLFIYQFKTTSESYFFYL